MYSLKAFLTKSPVQISAFVTALLNLAIITHTLDWSTEAVAGANTVLILGLGLFVSSTTVNSAKLAELDTGTPPHD